MHFGLAVARQQTKKNRIFLSKILCYSAYPRETCRKPFISEPPLIVRPASRFALELLAPDGVKHDSRNRNENRRNVGFESEATSRGSCNRNRPSATSPMSPRAVCAVCYEFGEMLFSKRIVRRVFVNNMDVLEGISLSLSLEVLRSPDSAHAS